MGTDIGFIGLGNLGAPIAERMIEHGYTLTVHDIATDACNHLYGKGARIAESPREVANAATVVFACLPSPDASIDVALGPNGVSHGTAIEVYVELSTLGVSAIEHLSKELSYCGIMVVDNPIIGGNDGRGIADGSFSSISAGPTLAISRIDPILRNLTKNIFVAGERPGQAQICKMINNQIGLTWFTIACEAMLLADKAGLSPRAVLDVIDAGSARAGIGSRFAKGLIERDFYQGPMAIPLKDLKLYQDTAERLGTPSPLGVHVLNIWEKAAAERPDRSYMSLFEFLEQAP